MNGAMLHRSFARVGRSIRHHSLVGVIALFLALLTLGGIVFIAVGVMQSLGEAIAPWQSGLIVGASMILLSLLVFLSLREWDRSRERHESCDRPAEDREPSQSANHETHGDAANDPLSQAACLGEALANQVRKNGHPRSDWVIAALTAGVALGALSSFRRRGREKRKSPGC